MVVDGTVNWIGSRTTEIGRSLRRIQTAQVQNSAVGIAVGIAVGLLAMVGSDRWPAGR